MKKKLLTAFPSLLTARGLAPLALLALACGLAVADEPATAAESFRVEEIAEGVLLFRPQEDRADLTNALVAERGDGLLVVNAQPSPAAAERFLTELARRTTLPVRYLVLPHPHAEAAGGASAFPAETLVIATHGCRDLMRDPGFDFGAEARLRSASAAGWSEPPRRLPTLVLRARTQLADERVPVELLPVAHAHTDGDMLVQLPEQAIVYGGAIVFADRNPYARGALVGGWLTTMNNIAKARPALVVPLRGPALDARELRVLRDSLAWLRGHVDRGFIDGLKATEVPNWVAESDEIGKHFDLEARPNFVNSVIDQAVEEVIQDRRKRGLPY